MSRRTHWRRIKQHRNYTVDDLHRLLGASKGTVRRWLNDGLPAMRECKPFLILGRDLIPFLKERAPAKQKCKADECFCFSCRAPRRAAFGEAELVALSATSGNLRALCEVCSTVMHKRVSAAKLETLEKLLTISVTHQHESLRDSSSPCLNEHLHRDPKTNA